GEAGPVGDLAHRGGAERAEVATDDVFESGGLRGLGWWNPRLREPIEIGLTLVPRARRRHANHVDPQPDAVPRDRWKAATREQFLEVSSAPWARRKLSTTYRHRRRDVHPSATLD